MIGNIHVIHMCLNHRGIKDWSHFPWTSTKFVQHSYTVKCKMHCKISNKRMTYKNYLTKILISNHTDTDRQKIPKKQNAKGSKWKYFSRQASAYLLKTSVANNGKNKKLAGLSRFDLQPQIKSYVASVRHILITCLSLLLTAQFWRIRTSLLGSGLRDKR